MNGVCFLPLLFLLSFPEGICFVGCIEASFFASQHLIGVCGDTNEQQIPSGNDNKKSKGRQHEKESFCFLLYPYPNNMILSLRLALVALLCMLGLARPADAYSVLTHEQLIDLTWDSSIVPLLLSRYPTLTPEQIEHARAYAYGGCVIQDIGYYPLGDAFFSNLTHYVRSGDFVVNLFRNAGNADELAFAIGALSHYIGDTVGHAEATNLAVPIEFPKLGAEYGPSVNYAEGMHEHVQTEF